MIITNQVAILIATHFVYDFVINKYKNLDSKLGKKSRHTAGEYGIRIII